MNCNERKESSVHGQGDAERLAGPRATAWGASVLVIVLSVLVLAGCGKGNFEYNQGKKAEAINDYDSAVVYYDRALKADPLNTEYKL